MVPWIRQGNKQVASHLNILQTYAKTPEEVELFLVDSSTPFQFLRFSEVLAAFPSGNVPKEPFQCNRLQWQLQSCTNPSSKQPVHLAVLVPFGTTVTPERKLSADRQGAAELISGGSSHLQDDFTSSLKSGRTAAYKQCPKSSTMSKAQQQMQLANPAQIDTYDHEENALQRYGNGVNRSGNYDFSFSPPMSARSDSSNMFGTPGTNGTSGFSRNNSQRLRDEEERLQEQEVERRKFTRNLVDANRKGESLERYKAIVSLIEICKRRLTALLTAPGVTSVDDVAWRYEPAASLMQAVLDVGEALSSFGNCRFPEHSNEGRAILAGDYKALLRRYLSSFGFFFAQPSKEQLPGDLQEDVQTIGSLLATRCEAYNLLYDQLVRHVGLENHGNSTFILNHNSAAANPNTSITANPVNTTTASANSKSKAINQGMGAAAIAAAGLVGLIILRAMRGGGGGGGRGGRGKNSSKGSSAPGGSSSLAQQQKQLRIPKGKGGRELVLVSQLSQCGDQLRQAQKNDELLRDDWRLGRHVRLAWPPGPPEPPGYEQLAPDACNVTQLLQEMYG